MDNVEQVYEKQKKNSRLNWIIMLALIVGMTLVSVFNPADMVNARVEDNVLVLAGYEDVTYSIPIGTIENVSYVEDAVYADDSQKIACGTYTSEAWGEHMLYVNTAVTACIVVESESGTYVFNYENPENTKAFYEAFQELL